MLILYIIAHSNAMVKSDIHKLLPYSIHISMSVTITDIFNDPASQKIIYLY